MSRINNPLWIGLDGTPVTGQTPPQVIMVAGELTPPRAAQVQHAYHLFCLGKQTAVGSYFVATRALQDGTRVRMESMLGIDRVFVWAADGRKDEIKIPHGFVVETTWNTPRFYAKDTEKGWKALALSVPQALEAGSITGYNCLTASDRSGFFVEPLVRSQNGKKVWDWAGHGGTPVGGEKVFPINPLITGFVGAFDHLNGFRHGPAHIISDSKILSASGKVAVELPPEPNILLSGEDAVEPLCGAAARDGSTVALQAMRSAALSASSNICEFVFWNCTYRRTSLPHATDASYKESESGPRKVCGFRTPLYANEEPNYEVLDTLGEEPSQDLRYTVWSPTTPGAVFGSNGNGSSWVTGMTRQDRAMNIMESESAYHHKYVTNGSEREIENVLVVGGEKLDYLSLGVSVFYPVNMLWRAGQAFAYYTNPVSIDSFGYRRNTIERIDSKYERSGSPILSLRTPNGAAEEINLFKGEVKGELRGHKYKDTKLKFGRFSYVAYTYLLAVVNTDAPEEYYIEWYQANNIKPMYMLDYWEWRTGVGYMSMESLGLDEPIEQVSEERPHTTGDYTLKSRYIIDYDHRAKFFAAIRVEVECKDARWEEDQSFYPGWQKPVGIPTYTAKVFFESNWGGITESILLAQDTCQRKPYEFEALTRINPYYWPSPLADERPMVFWLPPEIRPDDRCMSQLKNIPNHQGVNPHLVSQESGITDDPKKTKWSDKGIEYSYIREGKEVPQRKMVRGMLYGRSFTLRDFPEALWLLNDTKCDAPEGGSQPPLGEERPAWFYMPALGAALDEKHRIELRDGKAVMWSDEIPASPGKTRPADPYERDTKLHSV